MFLRRERRSNKLILLPYAKRYTINCHNNFRFRIFIINNAVIAFNSLITITISSIIMENIPVTLLVPPLRPELQLP